MAKERTSQGLREATGSLLGSKAGQFQLFLSTK